MKQIHGEAGRINSLCNKLIETFSRSYTMSNVLLSLTSTGEQVDICDIVHVGSYGVLLITVLSDGADWTVAAKPENWEYRLKNSAKECPTIKVENPFLMLETFQKVIIDKLLNHLHIPLLCVKKVLVCSAPAAVFANKEAMTSDDSEVFVRSNELEEYITELADYAPLLTTHEVKEAADIIGSLSQFLRSKCTKW